MNVFRLIGDMTHLASFFILILRLYTSRSSAGISLKSQELFLLTFICRYTDVLYHYISLYNTTMKILYIGLSAGIVYVLHKKEPWKSTYDKSQDTFLHWKFIVAPCAVLSLIINERFTFRHVTWSFSIYLEAVAILPQLFMLQRHSEVENLTSHYIGALGVYRGMYILNWIYRSIYDNHFHKHYIAIVAGIIQTVLFGDFIYYYIQAKRTGGKMSLPSATPGP